MVGNTYKTNDELIKIIKETEVDTSCAYESDRFLPKTLLLTNHAPGRKSAGGIFIQKILDLYPKLDICCFHTKPAPEDEDRHDLSWLPMKYGKAPTKYGLRRFGYKVCWYSRPIVEYYFEKFLIPRLVNKAVRFGRDQKIERVIATLDSIATVQIAKSVAVSLGIPLVVIVWDPPKYNLCKKYGLDDYSCNRLLKKFDETVRFSKSCSVPSEGMKRNYEKKYGTKCVVMVYGSKPKTTISHIDSRIHAEKYLVGFAGSIIAKNVWDAFVSSLADRDWKINGRDIAVRMHGASLNLNTKIPLQIEFRGWRSHRETIQSLSETDIAYLPYWFDESQEEFVTLSFPSKIAAYMAAEVPVFYHGPKESTASEFIQDHKVGVCCYSLSHSDIIESLENYLADTDSYQHAKEACKVTFEKNFSASVFRERFSEFIGVRESTFLPDSEI